MTQHPFQDAPRTQRFDELSSSPATASVVTIGTFDGVHRGHQLLLARTVQRAAELDLPSVVVTFEPVPAAVLRPDKFPGRVCEAPQKTELLRASGVDDLLVIEFNRELAGLTPEAFLEGLHDALHISELWVGEGFALGRNRSGNVERLAAIGEDLGFRVVALPRLEDDDSLISSSAIRSAIMAGDTDTARRLLGRPFRVSGIVIHGAHLGRQIGYPTANFIPPRDLAPLVDGIYVSLALLPDERLHRPAMTYVGTRPTINGGDRQIETHLFDFDRDIYDQEIVVDLLGRLRPDAAFATLDELVAQLQRDEADARAYLARMPLDTARATG